jgi:hypothetical protein
MNGKGWMECEKKMEEERGWDEGGKRQKWMAGLFGRLSRYYKRLFRRFSFRL